MTKSNVGQAISIFAEVGVILSIVLLAYELHQNNELLQSQANLVLLQNRLAGAQLLTSDDGLGMALVKERADDELSPLDRLKLENYYYLTLSKWEWEHRQNVAGLIASANLPVDDWRAVFSSFPGFARLWSDDGFRKRFSSDFVSYVDDNVAGR
jgi:hypothetical protein